MKAVVSVLAFPSIIFKTNTIAINVAINKPKVIMIILIIEYNAASPTYLNAGVAFTDVKYSWEKILVVISRSITQEPYPPRYAWIKNHMINNKMDIIVSIQIAL
jgi:hypothetical protein